MWWSWEDCTIGWDLEHHYDALDEILARVDKGEDVGVSAETFQLEFQCHFLTQQLRVCGPQPLKSWWLLHLFRERTTRKFSSQWSLRKRRWRSIEGWRSTKSSNCSTQRGNHNSYSTYNRTSGAGFRLSAWSSEDRGCRSQSGWYWAEYCGAGRL